jgi:hypothetical protein
MTTSTIESPVSVNPFSTISTVVEKPTEVKIEKVSITNDLIISDEVIVKRYTSQTTFINKFNNKCCLKGKTLELTLPIEELKERIIFFTQEQIQKCHFGNKTCIIKVIDKNDLQMILELFKNSKPKIKESKVITTIIPEIIPEIPTTNIPEIKPIKEIGKKKTKK